MGPLIEGTVSSDEVLDTGYKASHRPFMIARQEKRELIKRIPVLFDAMARDLGPRVLLHFFSNCAISGSPSHLFAS